MEDEREGEEEEITMRDQPKKKASDGIQGGGCGKG